MSPYDSTQDTNDHISRVQEIMGLCSRILNDRADIHDQSKLKSPEKEVFDEFTPKLKNSTYGSDEYKGFLKSMGEALEHHYAHNSHHPENKDLWECPQCKALYTRKNVPEPGYPGEQEYRWCTSCFPEGYPGYFETAMTKIPGINGMTLFDLIEMVCDWKAATERHADGDIRRSLVINGNRFQIGEQLSEILENTVNELEVYGWGKPAAKQEGKPETKPDQAWLVTYECRPAVITIASGNNGFFAPGQEPLWHFSNVSEWIKCVYDPETEETK